TVLSAGRLRLCPHGWCNSRCGPTCLYRLALALHLFSQGEDGIRDRNVTGVQTCALPISPRWPGTGRSSRRPCRRTPRRRADRTAPSAPSWRRGRRGTRAWHRTRRTRVRLRRQRTSPPLGAGLRILRAACPGQRSPWFPPPPVAWLSWSRLSQLFRGCRCRRPVPGSCLLQGSVGGFADSGLFGDVLVDDGGEHLVESDLGALDGGDGDDAGGGCGEHVLHLHRLDDDDRIALVDSVAGVDPNGHDGPGHRSEDLCSLEPGRERGVGQRSGEDVDAAVGADPDGALTGVGEDPC